MFFTGTLDSLRPGGARSPSNATFLVGFFDRYLQTKTLATGAGAGRSRPTAVALDDPCCAA